MHPSKERRSGKYREAMVASWSMTSNCKKTTINLAERPKRSLRSRMMALGMRRRRHQVEENGRESEGAPVDCPCPDTRESAF